MGGARGHSTTYLLHLSETTNLELKSRLIHLVPTFTGLENEDPQKLLVEFHVVCISMKPHNVMEYQIKLMEFSFTVQDATKYWFCDLPLGMVNMWVDRRRMFLDKYFPKMNASSLRRDIVGISKTRIKLCTPIGKDSKICAPDLRNMVFPNITFFNTFVNPCYHGREDSSMLLVEDLLLIRPQ